VISRIVAGILISIFVAAFLTNFLLGTLEPARSFKLNFTICEPGERKGECIECSKTGLVFLPNDTFCKEKYDESYICTSLGTCIDTGCRCNAWENCVKQGAIPVCVLKPNTCFWGRNCTIRIKARFEDRGDYFDRDSFAGYLIIIHPDREIPLAKIPCYLNETKRILYKAVYDCRFDPLKLELFSSEKPYEAYFFWRNGFKEISFYIVPNKKAKNFFEAEAYFKESKDLEMEVESVWSEKGKWKFCEWEYGPDPTTPETCSCFKEDHPTYTAIKFRLRGSLKGRFLVCFEFINSTIPIPASTLWSVKLNELNYLRENLGSYYGGSNIYVYNCFVVDKDEYSELFIRRPILVYEDYDYVNVSEDGEIYRNTYVNVTFVVFNLTDEEISLPDDIIYVSSPADSVRERVVCTSTEEYELKDGGCGHDIPICCVRGCTGIENVIEVETCYDLNEDEVFPSTCIDKPAEERGMPRQIGCSKCCRTCCNVVGNSCNECAEVPCNIFCGGFGPSSWWECCKCINPYYEDECECGG